MFRCNRRMNRDARGLDKPGGDLLSRALRQSTIGAERLNDRVRDGIGWGPLAITTRLMQATKSVC